MNKIPRDHYKSVMSLFSEGNKWSFPNKALCYKENEMCSSWKVLSIEVPAGSIFDKSHTKKIPYLRYYYYKYDETTVELLNRIGDMIRTQYEYGNLKVIKPKMPRVRWYDGCVFQPDRMVRLSTLNQKRSDYKLSDLRHDIASDERVKIVVKNGRHYVVGIRFRNSRGLDSPYYVK